MAQAGQHGQQRKDLELVFSLQSHYKHFFKNYGDIVGVYDIPSITMLWESFKSYLLKNSGILFDNSTPFSSSPSSSNSPQPNSLQLMEDIQIRYVNTSGVDLPINNQEDFQYALYSFRERARIGEINHLKLNRVKGSSASSVHSVSTATIDNNVIVEVEINSACAENTARMHKTGGADGLEMGQVAIGKDGEKPPEWFSKYMKKFKQEIIQEITKVNTTQMSNNMKKIQAANHVVCPKRRQNKSEHYKRRPKMTYANNIAAENTSCDNTDINTIATTPKLFYPKNFHIIKLEPKSPETPTRKHDTTPQQQKPDSNNKQIKLKAKRLANNPSTRGSSDSDTLTVIKQIKPKLINKTDAKYRECESAPLKKMADFNAEQYRNLSEVESDSFDLPPNERSYVKPKYFVNSLRSVNGITSDYNSAKVGQNTKMNPVSDDINDEDIRRWFKAEVLGEERRVCNGHMSQMEDVYVQRWQLKNTGLDWNSRTTMRFSWGSIKPILPSVLCPSLKSGECGSISMYFKIPDQVGSFECYCYLHHNEQRFGPWLGFRVAVTNVTPSSANVNLRAVITTLYPPEHPHLVVQHQNTAVLMKCDHMGFVDNIDDVVAVIQGMVVRDDDLVAGKGVGVLRGGNCSEEEIPTFKRFKGNGHISTDEQDELFIHGPEQALRYAIEKQQLKKQLQLHTDSDNDEEDSDDDNDDDDNDDVNIGKDLVIVDKQHLQDNSDSDNASIVSIAESNQSNHSVAPTNISVAGSYSSGTGTGSDEFVVIPMPKRNSQSLSDGPDCGPDAEGEDNSCPELEPDPDCYGGQKKHRHVMGNDQKKDGDVFVEMGGSVQLDAPTHHQIQPDLIVTQSAPPIEQNLNYATMARAVAIALQQQHQENSKIKQEPQNELKQQQQQRDNKINKDNISLDRNNKFDDINVDKAENVKTDGLKKRREFCKYDGMWSDVDFPDIIYGKGGTKKIIFDSSTQRFHCDADINVDGFWFGKGFNKTAEEQQTCPVDLSTNSSKGHFASNNAPDSEREKSETKQHCAATLCDLCTNIIMKNKLESAKNRLFVFPEDSPGFEVFTPLNSKCTVQDNCPFKTQTEIKFPVVNLVNTENISSFTPPTSQTTPTNQNPSNQNIVAQPDNTATDTVIEATTDNSSSKDFVSVNYFGGSSKDCLHDADSSSKDFVNVADLDSMSNGDSVFLCPSCHCDGECSKLSSESEYRNQVKSINGNKCLTAEEIRAQMRDLFVQLAELEPQKDPYLVKQESPGNVAEKEIKEDTVTLIHVEEQQTSNLNVPLVTPESIDKQTSTFSGVEKNNPWISCQEELDENEVSKERPFFNTDQVDGAYDLISETPSTFKDFGTGVWTKMIKHTGFSKPPLTHNHMKESGPHPQPSSSETLIDAPIPEGSFIEGATAPVENDGQLTARTAEEKSISLAIEQQRLIQLHCNHDTALADNMTTLYEMGFPNFFGNLQLLKAHENNIILVLEQLLPRF